jgi:hypothetical protein
MTAAKWLRETDPEVLMAYLMERRPSERKLRLFAIACSRRTKAHYENRADAAEDRKVTALAERFADGLATAEALAKAFPCTRPRGATWIVADPEAANAAQAFVTAEAEDFDCGQPHKAILLRDLFGNPFHLRKLRFDSGWLTLTVVSLAMAAYEERLKPIFDLDPVRLAILADALEDAGCGDEAILGHLRSSGPHIRGCWALDLCLNKQ